MRISLEQSDFPDIISMDELLSIQDESLKKFLFCTKRVQKSKWEFYKIDNKNKAGWYHKYCSLKVNNNGKIYKASTLKEWIVYNKNKKEVSLSTSLNTIKYMFLKEFIKSNYIIECFIPSITKTLVKKFIEGKINTFSDLVSYHKSYTIKNKNLSDECVARFVSVRMSWVVGALENPEEFVTPEDFLLIEKCPSEYISMKFKKLKKEELIDIQKTYENWTTEENKKYAGLFRQESSKTWD